MWKPIILDVECIVCNKSLQKINHDPREVTRKMGKIGKIPNRRSRTPNWSADEKQFLLELIKERKIVVVNKTNNGPNHSEEKDVAWNEILRELATRFGNKFDGSSIKKVKTQWQNMKRIAREEISLNGPELHKYTRQSFEVCNILDLVKDGVLRNEAENLEMNTNESTISTNVEIKAERLDEDMNQPSCSNNSSCMEIDTSQNPPHNVPVQMETNYTSQNTPQNAPIPIETHYESSSSEQYSEQEPPPEYEEEENTTKNASANTEPVYVEDVNQINPFHRDFKEYCRYSTAERQLKLESLKEERHIMKAMRETAELNKIIAEQRLKHILWIKRQEMLMYSGEPGSGAGKGGGGGGAIREAGGTFGKMEAAREDEYFYKKQKEQLANLKTHLDKEISFHQEQIKRHEDAIRRHKEQLVSVDKK